MSTEKTLKIQVAEALGWSDFKQDGSVWTGFDGVLGRREVPDYGTTFCATGPLIVHYGILLGPEYEVRDGVFVFADKWGAKLGSDRTGETIVYGPSACETVARLIVSLHERGELQRV